MLVRVNSNSTERSATNPSFINWHQFDSTDRSRILSSAIKGDGTSFQFAGHGEVRALFAKGGPFEAGGVMRVISHEEPVIEITCVKRVLVEDCPPEFCLAVRGYDGKEQGGRENSNEFIYPLGSEAFAGFIMKNYPPQRVGGPIITYS